jgi:uncharacterized protein YdiU (UPF0061 family)
MDMTMFFRELSHFKKDDAGHFHSRLRDKSYSAEFRLHATSRESWLRTYSELLHTVKSEDTQRKEEMNRVNPKYVLRNYMAQLAIDAAEEGNYSILEELYQVLKNPYTEQSNGNKWYAKRPDWAREKVGSSMLSCSS